jgi:hypothetical protein
MIPALCLDGVDVVFVHATDRALGREWLRTASPNLVAQDVKKRDRLV